MQIQFMQMMVQAMMAFQQAQAQQMQDPPRYRRRELIKGRPPIFSHTSKPQQTNDWLKSVERQLEIAQCTDMEKVLYASRQLKRATLDWWESYTSHKTLANITWQEFKESFISHHVPIGLLKLKKKDFLSLKQGSMSVCEYWNQFS